jgi:hypothetical protein
MTIVPLTKEDHDELRNLHCPLGQEGSGRVRYAAAMYFHGRGLMSDGHLEAYRICAKDDAANPRMLMNGKP